jgi:hypothetical protein
MRAAISSKRRKAPLTDPAIAGMRVDELLPLLLLEGPGRVAGVIAVVAVVDVSCDTVLTAAGNDVGNPLTLVEMLLEVMVVVVVVVGGVVVVVGHTGAAETSALVSQQLVPK